MSDKTPAKPVFRTAIILAGGEGKRAGGRDKYFFSYRGETFIKRVIESLESVVDEIIIVAKNEEKCGHFQGIENVHIVSDIVKGRGPIGGLQAGVPEAKGEVIFVSACDMPFLNPDAVNRLFEHINDHDAIIPAWDEDKIEPLHAIYRRDALEKYLKTHKSLSLRAMIHELNSKFISVEEFRDVDPNLRTFTNINKLEELKKLEEINTIH